MLLFKYILILLFAIFLSNFINRFLPSVTVPIIQIILGACIALLPLDFKLELDPDLFLVLFIAPLIFFSSMLLDKKSFWDLKYPILNMAFLLVFVSVIGFGYLAHLMIPSIPLVAAFVLMAALAPTDDIAVISIGKRVNIPPKIMNILTGESIINDASGIVCFQFAVLAAVTGSFSPMEATGRFILVGLGGVLVGLLFTLLKYVFVKWIRSLGMENVTLHILIEILTPFLVYLVADMLHVSAILAIFSAGIAHSFGRKELNPESATLNIASDSIWNVLTFTLEGLVFIILGTQLPDILRTVQSGEYAISTPEIILYILIITLVFAVSRFVWSYFTIPKKSYADATNDISKVRACMIFSLSGARGAVTLAIVLSIPVFLSDGTEFPQRDLIILIATGVILCSLLLTNFVLPLFVEKDTPQQKNAEEKLASLEILRNVMKEISAQSNDENRRAAQIVIREYLNRISTLKNKNSLVLHDSEADRKIIAQIYEWEMQNVKDMCERGEIDESLAMHYLDLLQKRFNRIIQKKGNPFKNFKKTFTILKQVQKFASRKTKKRYRQRMFIVMKNNNQLILQKLKELRKTEDNPVIDAFIFYYEFSISLQKDRGMLRKQSSTKESLEEVASHAFQLERDNIQMMFEEGRISRETAKEMRDNISLLETQMK